MIEVHVFKSRGNTIFQKNGTFLEGELYFGRYSKDDRCYVVRSEEGYWIPVVRYTWAKRYDMSVAFERRATIYMKNRKRLNQFASVEEYLDGKDNYNQFNMYYPLYDKEVFS